MDRSAARRLAPILFWFFVAVGSYALFEFAARHLAPLALEITTELDAALAVVDEDFGGDVNAFIARENDPTRIHPHPILGWDKPPVIYESCAECAGSPLVVLVLGDSVTQGHGVRIGAEDYTFLMSRLADDQPIRIVNAGVGGFGVDQMVLKAQRLIEEVQPDVIIFSYIAHDLLRPGRQFIYLRNRPSSYQIDRGLTWEPPADDADYIENYRRYRDNFATGIWLGGFIWDNRRYYAPYLYRGFFEAVFDSVVERMRALATEAGSDLVLVRLPQSFRFPHQDELVALMDKVVARHAAAPGRPISTPRIKECVVDELESANLTFDIMAFHPSAAGHRAYARCVFDAVLAGYSHAGSKN